MRVNTSTEHRELRELKHLHAYTDQKPIATLPGN